MPSSVSVYVSTLAECEEGTLDGTAALGADTLGPVLLPKLLDEDALEAGDAEWGSLLVVCFTNSTRGMSVGGHLMDVTEECGLDPVASTLFASATPGGALIQVSDGEARFSLKGVHVASWRPEDGSNISVAASSGPLLLCCSSGGASVHAPPPSEARLEAGPSHPEAGFPPPEAGSSDPEADPSVSEAGLGGDVEMARESSRPSSPRAMQLDSRPASAAGFQVQARVTWQAPAEVSCLAVCPRGAAGGSPQGGGGGGGGEGEYLVVVGTYGDAEQGRAPSLQVLLLSLESGQALPIQTVDLSVFSPTPLGARADSAA
ncbi:hypothetical protein T484DRAFT_1876485, partial [Baffinella frigidus]